MSANAVAGRLADLRQTEANYLAQLRITQREIEELSGTGKRTLVITLDVEPVSMADDARDIAMYCLDVEADDPSLELRSARWA